MGRHWAIDYIGKKWEPMGRGPDIFDCWGLCYHVYQNLLCIKVPMYPISPLDRKGVSSAVSKAINDSDWIEVFDPKEYDVVCMGRREKITHVGIYTETAGGMIVHANEKQNVIAQYPSVLNNSFYETIRYYRHAERY